MADDKKCLKCGERIRRPSPLFETCTKCRTPEERRAAWATAKRKSEGRSGKARKPKSDPDDQVLERAGLEKAPKAKSDAVKRFRVVAEAMGYEPDELLATYCEGWLAAVKQSVDKIEAPSHE